MKKPDSGSYLGTTHVYYGWTSGLNLGKYGLYVVCLTSTGRLDVCTLVYESDIQ